MSGSARLMRKPTTTSGASASARRAVEPADVRDVELAVAVGEGDELVAGRREARAERGAVAEVRRVVDGAHDVRVARGEVVGDRRRRVARPVVDRDDLERLREQRQRRERLVDEALEVRLLVVGREEVRQAGHAGRLGDARRGHGLGGHGAARRASTCISRPSSCEVSWSISYRASSSATSRGSWRIDVDGPDPEVGVDHVGQTAETLVEAGPVVDDEDIRPPAFDDLGVPERRRIAPPADDHRVRLQQVEHPVRPGGRLAVAAHVDRGVACCARPSSDGATSTIATTQRHRGAQRSGAAAGTRRCRPRRRRTSSPPRIASHVQAISAGPEVVARDVGVLVGRGEEAGDQHRGPGQERVARLAQRRDDERDRDDGREDPELARRSGGRARPSCRRGRRTGPAGCPGTARRAPHTRSPPTSRDGRRRAAPGRDRPGAAARGRRGRRSRPARPRR